MKKLSSWFVVSAVLLGAVFVGSSQGDEISKGKAGKSSVTKQFGAPNYFVQRRPVRYTPSFRQPQRSARRPIVAFRQPQRVSQRRNPNGGSSIIATILYYIFVRRGTTTTAEAATTTPVPTTTVCSVAWGSWTTCNLDGLQYRSRVCPAGQDTELAWRTCSADCLEWSEYSACAPAATAVDQKRSRTRSCKTGLETQQEACYTTTTQGYTSDGWYRNTNGYEYYYISAPSTYTIATTTCNSLDSSATLASVGARAGILESLDTTGMGIPAGAWYFVGASDAITDGTWIFQDGEAHLTAALPFASSEPNSGTSENCMLWVRAGGSFAAAGMGDVSCGSSYPGLCERKVA